MPGVYIPVAVFAVSFLRVNWCHTAGTKQNSKSFKGCFDKRTKNEHSSQDKFIV